MTRKAKFKIIGRQESVEVVSGYIVSIETNSGFAREFGIHKIGHNLWELNDIESGLLICQRATKWECIDYAYARVDTLHDLFCAHRYNYQWAIDKINVEKG